MDKIVLQPTTTAHWHALVSEAQIQSDINLGVELESYLVFLLMRFTNNAELANSVVGLDFLHGCQALGKFRQQLLRDVGDKCLLFTGLFPGRAWQRRVGIGYFIGIGQSAYEQLRTVNEDYDLLAQGFVEMMDVLQAMRTVHDPSSDISLLLAEELWREAGSKRAFSVLQRHTHGFIIPGDGEPKDDKARH